MSPETNFIVNHNGKRLSGSFYTEKPGTKSKKQKRKDHPNCSRSHPSAEVFIGPVLCVLVVVGFLSFGQRVPQPFVSVFSGLDAPI